MKTTHPHIRLDDFDLDVMTIDLAHTGNFAPVFQGYLDRLLPYEADFALVAPEEKAVRQLLKVGSLMLTSFVEIMEEDAEDDTEQERTELRHCILVMAKIMNRVNVLVQRHHNPWLTLPSTQSMFEDFLHDSGYLIK